MAGRIEAAISSYGKAVNVSPGDPGIYLNLGMGYLMMEDSTASQTALAKAFQSFLRKGREENRY